MRIFYPLEGAGCRVVVGRGFIEGFCDDHENCQLVGLLGLTFFLDKQFQLTNVQFRNGDLKQWQGEHLGLLLEMAQEKAQEEKPPSTSGLRPAVRIPDKINGASPKPVTPRPFVPPLPREDPEETSPSKLDFIPGKYVIRRRGK